MPVLKVHYNIVVVSVYSSSYINGASCKFKSHFNVSFYCLLELNIIVGTLCSHETLKHNKNKCYRNLHFIFNAHS